MSEGEQKLYSTKQAAEYTGKGIATIKRAVKNGRLVGIDINNRMRVFTQDELDQWAKTVGGKGRPKKGQP